MLGIMWTEATGVQRFMLKSVARSQYETHLLNRYRGPVEQDPSTYRQTAVVVWLLNLED